MHPRTREFLEKLRDLMGEYGAQFMIAALDGELDIDLTCDKEPNNWNDVDMVKMLTAGCLQHISHGYLEKFLEADHGTT